MIPFWYICTRVYQVNLLNHFLRKMAVLLAPQLHRTVAFADCVMVSSSAVSLAVGKDAVAWK